MVIIVRLLRRHDEACPARDETCRPGWRPVYNRPVKLAELIRNRGRLFWTLNIAGWTGYTLAAWLGALAHEKPESYFAVIVASAVSGYMLSTYTDAAYPYIDSLTTWAAIWATFLVARKVLENWWYWLAIDIASVFIYWSRELQLTSLLFVVYVIMIPFGLISWTRSWREAKP